MNLKETLIKHKIKQIDFSKMVEVPKQQVSYWCNKGMSKIWEKVLRKFFEARNMEIIEKK